MTIEAAGSTRAGELLRRPWVAALVVLVVYGALAMLNSTGGYLGTDTGAKVATLDRMADGNTFRPDVGYWAEEWDPAGTYHPLLDTSRNAEGEWVNVTTLPMLVAARPLYELGGYRLALLLPMLGAVMTAFAVRDGVGRLGDERSGWNAYWLVALGSPITVYALDFWEHSLGAGLMLLAFAILLRAADGGHWMLPLLAGAALGLSATMRTESLVAAAVFIGGTALLLTFRGRVAHAVRMGALALVGFAAPWLLNARLEDALGGSSRVSRASTAVALSASTPAGSGQVATRLEEASTTWFGIPGLEFPASAAAGALTVAGLVLAAHLTRGGHARGVRLALGVAVAGYVLVAAAGLGFVPGALVATPIAALAFATSRWTTERVAVLGMALAATVLIWTFQFTGGAGPQWGGRYLLAPTMLLLSLGVVAVHASGTVLRRGAFALSVIVTLFGVMWLHERSHGVDAFFEELADQPEQVVIAANGFLVREAGSASDDRRYLSVGRGGDVEGAVEVVRAADLRTFGVLSEQPTPRLGIERHVGSEELDFLGVPLWYHRYELTRDSAQSP